MSKLSELVDFLKNADKSMLSQNNALEILDDIFSNIGIIQNYNLHPGFFVIRVRPDFEYKNNINIEELSYKPKFLNKEYQRASIPNDTMFYCCSCERRGLIDEKLNMPFTDIEDGLFISLFETISELRDDPVFNHSIFFNDRAYKSFRSVNNFTKKVTYSIWIVDHFLSLALLPIYKGIEINSSFMHFPHSNYDFLAELNIMEPIDLHSMINFYQYITNEFTKYPIIDNKQYLISACATKILCEKHDCNGVVYPSVRCDGNGINLAIAPDVIDKGWLKCVELGNFNLICKDNNLLLEDITTQYKYQSFDNSSLLERSIELNRSGKKEMINLNDSYKQNDAFDVIKKIAKYGKL
jgi:hypothetical protein